MSGLANPDRVSELSGTNALRERRNRLLREADRHRYRLHRLPKLTEELQRVTTALLQHELDLKAKPEIEPLGDAGAAGGQSQGQLPYKD